LLTPGKQPTSCPALCGCNHGAPDCHDRMIFTIP
jgi:hypothetical protein